MDEVKVNELIEKALEDTVWSAFSQSAIERVAKKNSTKVHFIPVGVRVFSGVVQSLNIRYGNFIQALMGNLVKHESTLALHELSGKKVDFRVSGNVDIEVDKYMGIRKQGTDSGLDSDYQNFRERWKSTNKVDKLNKAPNDIDLLFTDKDNQLVYVELKFNDDHDTGKHPDIYRKVLKTGLAIEQLVSKPVLPCVYYFNAGQRNLTSYLPSTQRFSGADFFEKYLTVDYSLVASRLKHLSETDEVKARFQALAESVLFS
jgi:hypothetical protein